MAKFHGMIGFAEQYEKSPGVFVDRITEREYFGDVLSVSFASQVASSESNDELKINKRISIVSNQYAFENLQYMKYVTYMGAKWRITNAEPQYPRIVLSIGGVYNAQ